MKDKYEQEYKYIFVPVIIENKNNKKYKMNFLFDTGAAKTELSHAAAERMKYSAIDGLIDISSTTIAGTVKGYRLVLPEFSVFKTSFKNFQIGVFDIAYSENRNEDIDGLLGMDVITQMKLVIDGPNRKIFKSDS